MSCIVESSKRIVALIDLAGNPKYLRSTLMGITSCLPHYCVLVIDASSNEPLGNSHLIIYFIFIR